MKTNIKTYYFAYGSNLHMEQMKRRCPGSQPVTPVELTGWRLVFRGVADIVTDKGSVVAGALYTISRTDELALDRYEGYVDRDPKAGLYRKKYLHVKLGGENCRLMFYVMNRASISYPSEGYFNTILHGFKDWALPTDTLYTALSLSRLCATGVCHAR